MIISNGTNGVKRKYIIIGFVSIQLILLGVELFTHYDTTQRQIALSMTNVASVMALLLFDRWLIKKGSRLSLITFLFVAISVWLDALGNFQHMYAGFWWWDRVTHTIGGMALSALFIDIFLALRRSGKLTASWGFSAWMGLLVGQLIGSIYEISEWLGDYWFHTQRVTGLYDSPHDLFQNLMGGLLVLGLMFFLNRKKIR